MDRFPIDDLPVSGAWTPDKPVGSRKFFNFAVDRPFILESGGSLGNVILAYETWGQLNEDASNAVLICHAWTGDSHAAGVAEDGHPTPGWWEQVIGPGKFIDPERWYVVCVNVLGGCQGSTGPASINLATGKPYGSQFPVVTIRDMVRTQALLSDYLGVRRWHSVIGGSMGGMQVLEWAITFPDRVGSLVPIATCLQSTAQQIAWGAIGRRAIRMDPNWHGGDYYSRDTGPTEGLAIARMIAQVTFRSDNAFTDKFGRSMAKTIKDDRGLSLWDRFEVERYLDYHGTQLIRRFDANSYLIIGKAMELHDVAHGRGGLKSAMRRIHSPALAIGIETDILYPDYQEHQIQDLLVEAGNSCAYVNIDSPNGHDGFLIEHAQVGAPIEAFLDDVWRSSR